MLTQYNSLVNPENSNCSDKISNSKSETDYLAKETFRILHRFIDISGWGTKRARWDEDKPRPKPVVTKQIKQALTEWNNTVINPATGYRYPVFFRDENGIQTTDRFNFFIHYHSRLWSAQQIQKCFDQHQKMYYTSSRSKLRMAYLDGDAHEPWQNSEDSKNLFQKLFGSIPFFRSSPRGYNGWVKVICVDTAKWNQSLKRLENAICKLRYQYRCTCDLEIKGGANTPIKNAALAKLPCWNWNYPCQKHDPDDCWNISRMKEFEKKPVLTWLQWLALISKIESQLNEADVSSGKEHIGNIRLKYQKQESNPRIPQSNIQHYQREVATTKAGGRAPGKRSPKVTDLYLGMKITSTESLESIRKNNDAWVRDLHFTCWLTRQLKRLPTVEEALHADKQHNIYRGIWSDGLSERERRYSEHIKYIAKNYNRMLSGSGLSTRPQLDEKIREWRGRSLFISKKIVVTTGCTKTIDQQMKQISLKGRRTHVMGDHVLQLAAIIDHVSSSHDDNGIPRVSIQGWWGELAQEGQLPRWSKDYYYACRSVLVRRGWLKINHEYLPGAKAKTATIRFDSELVGTTYNYPEVKEYKKYTTHMCNSGVAINSELEPCTGINLLLSPFRGPP